jgi:hypothetical protein
MPSMIDHIVIVDRDLDQMVREAESLGFTVVPGGEHAGGMTHNALIAFADGSYIELIAFIDPEKRSTHRWWPRLWKGGGLVDYALLCADLEAEVEAIRMRGLDLPQPVENGRLRPDGQRLDWRQCFPQPVVGENGLPFLIEDVTPRSLRVPHEPEQTTHRNGVTGIAGVTVLVGDFVAASGALVDITGNEMESLDAPIPGVEWAGRVPVGGELGQWIAVATPDMALDESFGEAAEPSRYLDRYGMGPFSAVLTTGKPAGDLLPRDGAPLDASLLAGARLRSA